MDHTDYEKMIKEIGTRKYPEMRAICNICKEEFGVYLSWSKGYCAFTVPNCPHCGGKDVYVPFELKVCGELTG